MKTRLLLLIALTACLVQTAAAQTPRWANRARQAVFSVITYDAADKMLGTGNGFYIAADGTALSDFVLFRGAARAEVIGADGKTYAVSEILGANEIYDVVKFRVATTTECPSLQLAAKAPAVGERAYLLPYSTQQSGDIVQGKVSEATKIESSYGYYTLELTLRDKMASCPLVNAEGQVFGIAQLPSSSDDSSKNTCYALDARFGAALSLNALSLNDGALSDIGIKKGLPDDESQALVMLYMASTTVGAADYRVMLDDFIKKFPESADGYMRRAQFNFSQPEANMQSIEADMQEAVSRADDDNRADVYYQSANIVYNYCLLSADKPYGDWTWDKALDLVKQAEAVSATPIYSQLEGDICFAKQDYAGAYAAFEKVNSSNIASASSYYSAAHSKEMMQAPIEEVVALMDSCLNTFGKPYTQSAAPYLLERARIYMQANMARPAMLDYEEYYKVVNGQVNDVFYQLRGQSELRARAYQRALDDYQRAIEMNPDEATYRAELAAVHITVGQYNEAVSVLDAALERNPNYADLYRLKGLALIQLKKNKEARPLLDKAKELGDTNVDALIEKYY